MTVFCKQAVFMFYFLLALENQIFFGCAVNVSCENAKFLLIEKFHFHDCRRTILKFVQLNCYGFKFLFYIMED